jgi:hypothetical protein
MLASQQLFKLNHTNFEMFISKRDIIIIFIMKILFFFLVTDYF